MENFCNREAWSTTIDRIVDELRATCDSTSPPFDALSLAARLGFVVAVDARQNGRGRCALLPGGEDDAIPAIFLRPEPRNERRQWTVAHEIGEHFTSTVFDSLGLAGDDLSPELREQTANVIASRLLLPTRRFFVDGSACDWDLLELKRRYDTASHELIARRMLEGGPPAIVTVFDQGVMQFRRGRDRTKVPPPSPAEREVRNRAHASGKAIDRRAAGMRIRAWPVHEAEWKREILRTEPLEIDAE